MTDPNNPFRLRACKLKAERIAEWLERFEATPEQVAEMSEEGWRAAAALADVPWGQSEDDHQTTKAMVIGALSMPRQERGTAIQ